MKTKLLIELEAETNGQYCSENCKGLRQAGWPRFIHFCFVFDKVHLTSGNHYRNHHRCDLCIEAEKRAKDNG